jgi:hypothetical protein
MFGLAAIGLVVVALSACNRFHDGGSVLAVVEKDPRDPCRIVITEHLEKIPAMTARIDGCKP